jgi:hypothetical protein
MKKTSRNKISRYDYIYKMTTARRPQAIWDKNKNETQKNHTFLKALSSPATF